MEYSLKKCSATHALDIHYYGWFLSDEILLFRSVTSSSPTPLAQNEDSWKLFYVDRYFACMGICALHVCSAHRGQKRAPDPVELELHLLVHNIMGAGNWT